MSDQKVQVTITGDASGLLKALQSSAAGTEAMAHNMEKAMGGVAATLEKFAAPLTAFLGILGGGAIFKEAVSETAALGDELAKGAQKAGVTVEALSGLAHAAKLSDVAFEDLVGGMGKLAKNMQEAIFTPTSKAAAAFKALGIEVETADGHLKPTDEVLGEIAEKFRGFKDGADKTALAMNLFGKSGAQMIPLLNEGKEGIAELTAEAQRLGITMSTEQAKAAEKYKDDMERVGQALTGLKMRIGEEVMPALTRLAEWFTQKAPEMLENVTGALRGLGAILGNTVVQWAALTVAISWSVESLVYPALIKAVQSFQMLMVQMALARMEGMSALTSLAAAVNPVYLVTGAVVALAFGYRHLVTEESRAAEEHLKEVERLGAMAPRYQQLTARLVELDDIQKSAKSSASAKKAAEKEEKTIIQQLVAIYPDFMKFLYDESGKRREIAEAIKLENKDRLENAQRTVAEAQAHLANAKALLEERKQRAESARYAPGGPGGAGVAKSAAQGYLNASIADSEQAIKIEDQALQQALQNLQKLQQATTEEANAPSIHPNEKVTKEKIKKEADNWLANYEALQAAEFEHWKNMEEISMDGLQKQEMHINLAFAKKLETAYQAGASEEDLAALNNARLRDIEQARTDFAQKQAEERKKIAEQEAQEARRLLEETGTAQQGFFDGLDQYIKRQGTVFQQFAQAAQTMLQGIENAFSRSIQGILTGQMTFSQAVKAVWTGIMGAISQAIAQIIAKWIVMKIAGAVLTKAELAESTAKTSALLSEGAAGAWAAYGWMPFVGAGLAMAQIALMETSVAAASLGALSTKGVAPEGSTGMTINAEGGYYTRPTVGLFGEKGPELVSPAVKFQDFASNLASNILAQERQAQAYGRQAAGYARAGAAAGGGGSAMQEVHLTLSNVNILDSSQRGLQQLGNHIIDALQIVGGQRGQVVVPGRVITGGI